MRLSENEIAVIRKTILRRFPDAGIRLFGSRADDRKKGGDIDLLIQTGEKVTLRDELELLAQMERNGIARKVDLVIDTPFRKTTPFVREAFEDGVSL